MNVRSKVNKTTEKKKEAFFGLKAGLNYMSIRTLAAFKTKEADNRRASDKKQRRRLHFHLKRSRSDRNSSFLGRSPPGIEHQKSTNILLDIISAK